jgi:hypothetical protein
VERVADLGEDAIPSLINCLSRPEPDPCANARAALARIAERWGTGDSRTVEMASQLAREFPRLSPAGQKQVLELTTDWFCPAKAGLAADALAPVCARVAAAACSGEPEVQSAALELAAVLLDQRADVEVITPCRELVRSCFRSSSLENRLRAVQLALRPDLKLLEDVVSLLSDPAVEVRRAALLAVGPPNSVVLADALLPSLHDPDPDVRELCVEILKSRDLTDKEIQLGRLLTDPRPLQRLKVFDQLRGADVDLGMWLRRLSHDPSPAVRAAAVRVISQQTNVDLLDRLDQMARDDASPTVSHLARLNLKWAQRPARPNGE